MEIKSLLKSKHPWARRLSRWFFGEVSYAILPLLVLAGITVLNDETFHGFAELKEWSFATIVFFGVTIRKFVRLKVEVQQSPTSHRLDAGIQAFIVCLVFSVLVLAFVVLKEKEIVSAGFHIGAAQLIFFSAGAVSLFMAVATEDAAQQWEFTSTTRRFSLKRMNSMLLEAEHHIEAVKGAQGLLDGVETTAYEERRLRQTLVDTMERIKRLIAEPAPATPFRTVAKQQ
jgi:hypothetical protein